MRRVGVQRGSGELQLSQLTELLTIVFCVELSIVLCFAQVPRSLGHGA